MATSENCLVLALLVSRGWTLLLLLVCGLITFFFYLSKCWEAWPIFESASGHKRFKQFVQTRIPESISDIRGGFRGFFNGEIQVFFRFRDCLEKELFLVKWNEITASGPRAIHQALFRDRLKISKAYCARNSQWLLIDDSQKIALLYVPFWFTVDDIRE